MDAAEAWLPRRMGEVEARLAELVGGHGEALAADAGGDPCCRRQAPAPDAGAALRRPRRGRRGDPRGDRDRARPHGDARPRRRPRRRPAAARPPDGLATSGPRRGHGRRRPALLARVRRAGRPIEAGDDATPPGRPARGRAAVALLASASVALALGELAQRRDAFDLEPRRPSATSQRCLLKTARLFECACAIGARPTPRPTRPLTAFGREIGLAFQLLDDVLDVSGPAGAHRQGARHRPARRHRDAAADPGAARGDPALAELDLRCARRGDRGRGLRPDRGDGRAGAGARRRARGGSRRRRAAHRRRPRL